jgi:hypothetical protein
MASMVDYMVLHDGAFEIDTSTGGPSDTKKLTFDLPADFTVGTNLAKPILAFLINPRSDSAQVGVWVNPEGPNVQLTQSTQEMALSWSKADHFDQAQWAPVHGTKFNKGGENQIWFKAWKGHLRVLNVILWYQRGSGA